MVLRTVVVAALVAGCSGADARPSGPTETPVASLARVRSRVATALPATQAPTASAMPAASPRGLDCGDTSLRSRHRQHDQCARRCLNAKRFAERWNQHAGDTKTGSGLASGRRWGTSGSYTGTFHSSRDGGENESYESTTMGNTSSSNRLVHCTCVAGPFRLRWFRPDAAADARACSVRDLACCASWG